jgi:hypothetical protein
MDDLTFQVKNLEFHIKQTSINYDKCISKAIKRFVDSEADFTNLVKPCENLKHNLEDLMKKYEALNASRLDH